MATSGRRVRYVGPFDAVEIEHPLGRMMRVERGEVVRLSARLADLLLEQPDNWVEEKKGADDAA